MTGETERALRALTCSGCEKDWPLVDGRHNNPMTECLLGGRPCDIHNPLCTYNPKLLPLFNAGIAGAYAAAAKHFPEVDEDGKLNCSCGQSISGQASIAKTSVASEWADHIRALTPADARQHVLPCDPNDQVSETQFQKVIWDAIASVLGPKGQILANSLQEKLTIGIRDYLRWNCERAKAHRGEK